MKQCTACGQMKPFTEYYKRSGMPHLYLPECKECRKVRSKQQVKIPKVSSIESEQDVTRELQKQGIPTLPGKALSHEYADLIAWGCVFIEVKTATFSDGHFSWSFSPEQKNKGVRGHVIVLVCDWGARKTYHVFNAKSPQFYDSQNVLKWAVSYTPNRKNGGMPVVFSDTLMEQAKDNWLLIDQFKDEVVDALKRGIDLTELTVGYRTKRK